MWIRNLICRALALLGIYPQGCPPRVVLGADRVIIKLKQKDR